MSHSEQMEFVEGIRHRFPAFFRDRDVLEVGSRDVNGSVRQFFSPNCRYVGIDCTPGCAVDVVTLAHQYKPEPGHLFDVIISCEAFEHDPYLPLTITNVMRYLRVGGLFVATMASDKRPEHGTVRSTGHEVYGPDPNYYRGVAALEFAKLIDPFLDPRCVIAARGSLDVYAHGFRAPTILTRPTAEVQSIRKLKRTPPGPVSRRRRKPRP